MILHFISNYTGDISINVNSDINIYVSYYKLTLHIKVKNKTKQKTHEVRHKVFSKQAYPNMKIAFGPPKSVKINNFWCQMIRINRYLPKQEHFWHFWMCEFITIPSKPLLLFCLLWFIVFVFLLPDTNCFALAHTYLSLVRFISIDL